MLIVWAWLICETQPWHKLKEAWLGEVCLSFMVCWFLCLPTEASPVICKSKSRCIALPSLSQNVLFCIINPTVCSVCSVCM